MEDIVCQKCEDGGDETRLLLCEKCPAAFHIYCLAPPLDRVPDEEWFCHTCKAKREVEERKSKGQKAAAGSQGRLGDVWKATSLF